MTFSDIELLWFIWAVPVVLAVCFWGIRKRNRILARYAHAKGLSLIAPDTAVSRHWGKAAMLLVVLLLLVVSLTGPQYGYRWRETEQRGVDLIIALDCSRSMLAGDIRPTRLDRAKREIIDLLNLLEGDRVGLVAFSGTAFLQCPLTLDYSAFHLFLTALTPDYLPVGGTNIGMAIETALSGFNAAERSDKAIILITDGENTGEDPFKAAQAAADAKVRLFCVGVGATDGVPIPAAGGGFVKDSAGNIVLTRLDEESLKKMAALTHGGYVRSVAGNMDLETIYSKHIKKEMEAATLSQRKQKVMEDRYQWFLSLAVLILVLEFLVPRSKKKGAVTLAAILLFLSTALVPAAEGADAGDSMKAGESAYKAGEFDKAIKHFIDAQLEAPDRPEIYYDLGNAQYKAGQYDAALNNYKQALKSPDPQLRRKSHYNSGNTLFRLGKNEEAIRSYESALEMDPNDVEAKENLAFVKKAMEQPKPPPQSGDGSKESSTDSKNEEKKTGDKKEAEKSEEKKGEEPTESPQSSRQGDNKDTSSRGESDGSSDKQSETRKQTEAGRGESTSGGTPEEHVRQQAEKMLNRLEDKPGRALIPEYQKRKIEKDW